MSAGCPTRAGLHGWGRSPIFNSKRHSPGAPGLAVFETRDSFRRTIPLCSSSQREPISCFYSGAMPWGLERWHGGHDLHFITFSCYRRQALLSNPHRRDLFLKVLEDVRRRYQWVVIGYVVMPEHVHLLVSEPQERPLATAIQALKLGFSRRLLAGERRLHHNAEHDKPGAFGRRGIMTSTSVRRQNGLRNFATCIVIR